MKATSERGVPGIMPEAAAESGGGAGAVAAAAAAAALMFGPVFGPSPLMLPLERMFGLLTFQIDSVVVPLNKKLSNGPVDVTCGGGAGIVDDVGRFGGDGGDDVTNWESLCLTAMFPI